MSFTRRRQPNGPAQLCALAAALLASLTVEAGEGLPELEYVAASGCPDQTAFLSLVRAHAGGRWQALPTRAAPRIAVSIHREGADAIGRLRRTDAGPSATREVVGRHCQEVAEALALTAALSLTEEPAQAPITVSARERADSGVRPSGPAAREWAIGAGLAGWAMLPPQPMAAGFLSVEYRTRARTTSFHVGLPDLRMVAFHARNQLLPDSERAGFQLSGAGLDACPLGGGGGALEVRLCGTGQLGALSGFGIDVAQPRRVRSLWAAAGLLARVGLRVGPRLTLELDAGAVTPWRRTEFVFDQPRIAVATVPRLIPQLGVTAAMTIP